MTNAVAFLEGYVRIRTDLLRTDRGGDGGGPADGRDAALLASDFLHAAAYEPIAAAPILERRTLDLYRTLAAGSSSLADRFLLSVGEPAADETGHRDENETETGVDHPDATLAATAAALGATATGASSDARTTLETYARSLSTALQTRAGAAPEPASVDPRDAAVRVLSGRTGDESDATARGGDGAFDQDRAPIARLERATRIPFRHEV